MEAGFHSHSPGPAPTSCMTIFNVCDIIYVVGEPSMQLLTLAVIAAVHVCCLQAMCSWYRLLSHQAVAVAASPTTQTCLGTPPCGLERSSSCRVQLHHKSKQSNHHALKCCFVDSNHHPIRCSLEYLGFNLAVTSMQSVCSQSGATALTARKSQPP